jgi:hypothetical protein
MADLKTATVYRVENSAGKGPYTDATPNEVCNFISCVADDAHPMPWDDDIPYPDFQFAHGFKSIRDLRNWFTPKGRTFLAGIGFCVAAYKAARVLRGKHQVVFRKDGPPVKTLSLKGGK